MKTIKFIITAIMAVVLCINVNAQNEQSNAVIAKSETFKVSGNCEMCKVRIEKAAKADGVSKAEWSDETKLLTLTYDPAKVKSDYILKKIATVGHDTEKFKADDKVYAKLPGCCQYDRVNNY